MKQVETDYKLTTPTREEIEFYIREGKRLQSEVFRNTSKSVYRSVIKMFLSITTKQDRPSEKPAAPLSGHHAHGN